jgi:NADH-quinone oxidoreductase subunit M
MESIVAYLLFTNPLSLFFLLSILTILLLLFSSSWRVAKIISLTGGFFQLFSYLLIWGMFDFQNPSALQYNIHLDFGSSYLVFDLGVDGIGLYFLMLSILLLPICVLCAWDSIKQRVTEFQIILHVVTLLLVIVFTAQDLLLFYVAFESILIPMFIMIAVWGSRERKIHAAYQFFMYTLVGSVLMLIAIIYMYSVCGSTNVNVLADYGFSGRVGDLLWLALFVAFAVKVPMFPFHIWLPEAHVEAPTAGSVLLAGILLKMGTYGLYKFSIPIFPEATVTFQTPMLLLSLLGIIFATLTTIRQVDLKKIIAYSSVGHMNYAMLGIAGLSASSLEGGVMLMLGHGFVSSALFICVGALYERHSTRIIFYYGGLAHTMPLFMFLFLILTLANVGLPGTSNFIGEFLIFVGVYPYSFFVAFLGAVMTLFSAVYSFWLYNRVAFGRVKTAPTMKFSDVNKREKLLIVVLLFFVFLMGISPGMFLEGFGLYLVEIIKKVVSK